MAVAASDGSDTSDPVSPSESDRVLSSVKLVTHDFIDLDDVFSELGVAEGEPVEGCDVWNTDSDGQNVLM